jgi:hypothetical protein
VDSPDPVITDCFVRNSFVLTASGKKMTDCVSFYLAPYLSLCLSLLCFCFFLIFYFKSGRLCWTGTGVRAKRLLLPRLCCGQELRCVCLIRCFVFLVGFGFGFGFYLFLFVFFCYLFLFCFGLFAYLFGSYFVSCLSSLFVRAGWFCVSTVRL